MNYGSCQNEFYIVKLTLVSKNSKHGHTMKTYGKLLSGVIVKNCPFKSRGKIKLTRLSGWIAYTFKMPCHGGVLVFSLNCFL
jgi:hypothetical protein